MKLVSSGSFVVFILLVLIGAALLILNKKPISLERPVPRAPVDQTSDLPILAEKMPEFQGITRWWNTTDGQPLTPEKLKGKVVLIDFWTYSCINCIRTQPVLRAWWKTYEKDGLVIVGVHTPEFAFEKVPSNVEDAIERAQLTFPIALDSEYATWNAYDNQYWPAEYFFDRQGRLRHTHFGEGNYDESEAVIRALLDEGGDVSSVAAGADSSPDFRSIRTHETYFGYARISEFKNQAELKRDQDVLYRFQPLDPNTWSLQGTWNITAEYAKAVSPQTGFRMNIEANAMHLVLGSANGTTRIQVLIDGRNPTDEELTANTKRQADGTVLLEVTMKDLYRIARFPKGGRHEVELRLLDPGVEFYAATFGE